jgi:hypothetical protein
MKSLATCIPIAIGVLLVYSALTNNNHSVQSCMVLCTGILIFNLGFIALALKGNNK